MRGNWIEQTATQTAANTNPTTLTASTNLPTYADVFGTTGTRLVEYEMDDAAGHFECGYGTINLATLSLSRDYPIATYNTGATPKYVSANASRLTAFSAGVTVRCAPLASSVGGGEALHLAGTGGAGNGYTLNQTDVDYSTGLQGWRNFMQFLWTGTRPITSASINVNTAATSGTMRVGIMEITGSGTYNLVAEFTVNTQFNLAVTGPQTISDFPPIFLPPGPYILQFVPVNVTGSPKLTGSSNHFLSRSSAFGRNSTGRIYNTFLDAAGATTLTTSFSGSPGGSYTSYTYIPNFYFGMS